MNVRTAVALVAALLAAVAPPAAAAEPVPAPAGISRFTRHPRFVEAKLSPEGTYLAAVALEGGKRTLVVLDLKTRKLASQLQPDAENMPGRFHWASDKRLVVELWRFEGYLDAPVTWGEIYAVDANGKNGKLIFGYRAGEDQVGSRIKKGERVRAHAWVLDTLRDDDRRILVAYTLWDELERLPRVEKVDVVSGVRTPVTVAPIAGAWLGTDEDGEVRIAGGRDEQLRWRWFQRDRGGTWRPLAAPAAVAPGSYPVGFVARDRTLYLVEPDGKGFGVVAVAIETGARRVLARQDMVEPSHLVQDGATGRIVAVEWEPDVPVVDVVEPEHPSARILRALEATYPDASVRVVSRTADEQKAVVLVYSDRAPGRFLLVDAATMTAETLFDRHPWIAPDEMAETSAFHVAASDGVRIHGYVTLPRGARERPPPMVVLPHGGPHGVRDHWGFDPQAQLLASEGFAALRVNYRGSGGYGDAYEEAGYGRWGDRVVQDVVDATRWAVRKGFADPARICAFGGSFGAYASMQAAILAPDLFRCAVGYAGVYDLTRMSWTGDISHTRLGRGFVRTAVGTDEAALRAASPVHNAEKLRARVLLVHGEEDRRTPLAHAEKLRDALAAAGRPPEWIVEPREGHGFYDEDARERMWARVLAFL